MIEYVAGSKKGQTENGDLFNNPFRLGDVDANYTSQAVVENVEAGDTVIFFMGTNDCLREVTIGNPSTDTSSTDTFCGKFKNNFFISYCKYKYQILI